MRFSGGINRPHMRRRRISADDGGLFAQPLSVLHVFKGSEIPEIYYRSRA